MFTSIQKTLFNLVLYFLKFSLTFLLLTLLCSCGSSDITSPDPPGDDDNDDPGGTPALAAYAGCEGWGCETEGGRRGDLYIVTSKVDSGPGSLREALEATGRRYIISQVDGIIDLEFYQSRFGECDAGFTTTACRKINHQQQGYHLSGYE